MDTQKLGNNHKRNAEVQFLAEISKTVKSLWMIQLHFTVFKIPSEHP